MDFNLLLFIYGFNLMLKSSRLWLLLASFCVLLKYPIILWALLCFLLPVSSGLKILHQAFLFCSSSHLAFADTRQWAFHTHGWPSSPYLVCDTPFQATNPITLMPSLPQVGSIPQVKLPFLNPYLALPHLRTELFREKKERTNFKKSNYKTVNACI